MRRFVFCYFFGRCKKVMIKNQLILGVPVAKTGKIPFTRARFFFRNYPELISHYRIKKTLLTRNLLGKYLFFFIKFGQF